MKRAIAVLAALTLPLVACGDDDSSSGAPDGTSTDAGTGADTPAGDEPVTIEHHFGTTTLEEAPERIVTIDSQWLDVMLALDGPVVGAAVYSYIEGGYLPWQADVLPDSVETITLSSTDIPYEAVAALRPDLILTSFAAPTQAEYDRLNDIAPTIGLLTDGQVDPWQEMATVAGKVLGRPDEAAALITGAEDLAAGIRAELPGLEGKSYAFVNYVPGDSMYVVTNPDDGAATFFSQIGLSIDPDLLALADGNVERLTLSLERIDELDSDVLLLLTNGTDTAAIPGYANLPAVQSGAVAILDMAQATALNLPSPLSLPYVIDTIRDALTAAAS